jgi:hypothetical protein
MPGVAVRRVIWRIYIARYGLDPNPPKPVNRDEWNMPPPDQQRLLRAKAE